MNKSKDKTPEQSRSWILTLPADIYDQQHVVSDMGKYHYIGQLERSSSGYDHWQIYVENKTPIRFDTLRKKFPKGHFEVRRGSRQQAYDYCTKSETSTGLRISNGDINLNDEAGRRTDVESVRDDILIKGYSYDRLLIENKSAARMARYASELVAARDRQLLKSTERDVTVRYLWGPSGVGKTRMLFNKYRNEMYRVSDYDHPFDNYRGEKILVLDEFYSQISHSLILNVLDRYPLTLPARYANKWAAYTEVWMVSNVPIDNQYMTVRQTNYEGWKAFRRRVTNVGYMDCGGTISYE